MKKIGIVTIIDYNNYGNRLQNYALQEFLKNQGLYVETILNDDREFQLKNMEFSTKVFFYLKNKQMKLLKSIKSPSKINNTKMEHYEKDDLHAIKNERKKNFDRFTESYITETNYVISSENTFNVAEKFDYFVAGSDQIWNPLFRLASPIDFLEFAPKEKRLAYAASFGVAKIPGVFTKKYKKYLKGINHISVREDTGLKIVKRLSEQSGLVLVDPTMLLSSEDWLSVKKESSFKPKEKYLLTYFLGEIPSVYLEYIDKLRIESGLKVVNLGQKNDKRGYTSGPSEFLDYINSAEIFLTDSYHGVVFSIIFSTPFVVFKRQSFSSSMYSRIETLLNKFQYTARTYEKIVDTDNPYEMDFDKVSSILESEQLKSLEFINKSINL